MHPLLPTTAEPALPPESGERIASWERLTREALAAQRQGRLDAALAGYVRALWAAEALLDDPVLSLRPDNCLAAAVISHHNLADLHDTRGQAEQAVDHLCQAHALLLNLSADECVPVHVRQATWRHLAMTRGELLAWRHRHGPDPAVDAALLMQEPPVDAGRHFPRH